MKMNKKMYINGQLVDGNATEYELRSPATDQPVANLAWANAADAETALAAADAAYSSWSATPIQERIDWMLKLRDAISVNKAHLCECIQLEIGKTSGEAEYDHGSIVGSLTFYAEEIARRMEPESIADREGTHEHRLVHESVGVVVAFIAWNFPLLNLGFKLGPAMATGCPLIVKPSFKSPLTAYAIGELCAEIGLPAGAVNIICGADEEVGDTLSSSTIPAMLTLIGSSRTAKRIMAKGASSIKRYSMELGGNAPALVFEDANLDNAADIISGVKYGVAGQICITPNRVFVNDAVMDNFRAALLERAANVKPGFSLDQDADFTMGPLIDKVAWERVNDLVQDAVAQGAEVLCGGGRPAGNDGAGNFFAPTVLDKVTPQMRIYNEEIFGPVVSLISFSDEDQALAEANATDTGLTAYVFTEDQQRADSFAARLRFGEIQVNGVKYAIYLPHIGIKQSGVGCDCSQLALNEYLSLKRVSQAVAA